MKQPILGERLRDWRNIHGLTQMQVCRKLKMSQTHLSQIEKDHTWPSRATLSRLLKLYSLELHLLPKL